MARHTESVCRRKKERGLVERGRERHSVTCVCDREKTHAHTHTHTHAHTHAHRTDRMLMHETYTRTDGASQRTYREWQHRCTHAGHAGDRSSSASCRACVLSGMGTCLSAGALHSQQQPWPATRLTGFLLVSMGYPTRSRRQVREANTLSCIVGLPACLPARLPACPPACPGWLAGWLASLSTPRPSPPVLCLSPLPSPSLSTWLSLSLSRALSSSSFTPTPPSS